MAQIYEIAVMWEDVVWMKSEGVDICLELPDRLWAEGLCAPLPLILGEEGKGPGAYGCSILGRIVHSAQCAHMGAYELSACRYTTASWTLLLTS